MTLAADQHQHIAVLLPETLITSSLLALIEPSLKAGGSLEVRGPAIDVDEVASELRMSGLSNVSRVENAVSARGRPQIPTGEFELTIDSSHSSAGRL